MSRKTHYKPIALCAPAVLLLAGCSSEGVGDTNALSNVEVHFNSDDQPEFVVKSPVETDEQSSRVVDQGDGAEIQDDHMLEVSSASADPATGEILFESFSSETPEYIYPPEFRELHPFIFEALTESDLNEGADIVLYEPEVEDNGAPATLLLLHIEDQLPVYATGEVQDQSGDLPEIDNVEGEAPELADHDSDQDQPEDLEVETLIQGEGEEVEENDQLLVQYSGWTWSDGEEFDSSWSRATGDDLPAPANFGLHEVVEGWGEGLPGNAVGSRVLLVLPPDLAYGEEGEHELAGETLIFVIDILEAVPTPEQPAMPEQPEMTEEELEELQEMIEQQMESEEDD